LAIEKTNRIPALINLLIAILGFALFAELTHLTAINFNERQTFALGFSLGVIVSGSVILQIRPHRPYLGFMLGIIGILVFAMTLFYL
jgi:hypothetical protein